MPVTKKSSLKPAAKTVDPTFVCHFDYHQSPPAAAEQPESRSEDQKPAVHFEQSPSVGPLFDAMSLHRLDIAPPLYTSYLRPNSKFVGIQQSGKSKYNIKVEFKHVDLANSMMTGFLQINGLTEHHPEITTCFKGEIINNQLGNFCQLAKTYSFITENKKWESDFRNDLEHWKKLTGYYYLKDEQFLEKLEQIGAGTRDQGLIYMRWKEEFLLPDARVKQIQDASFEGFYYIVLNVGNVSKSNLPIGAINGLYYHQKSELYQSLSLTNLDDDGVSQSFAFT